MGVPQPDSIARIGGDRLDDPSLSPAQRIAKKRKSLGQVDAELFAPDAADLSVRDVGSGRVRRARGGSRRSSFLGDTDWAKPPAGDFSLLGDL